MSRLYIRRAHALAHAEARTRVSHVAQRLSERFGAECRWEGDDLCVDHSNLKGRVTVRRSEIIVDGKLGFALSLFHERVEREVAKFLDDELKA
ncbi:MAG: polyhydroxyalkanoic acid system family protein [Steroidobacteraceae bacterium]|jgi:putative polyhydroxyalkanoate system protein|nr:polyhydroxyalkanoic acid system family protein [Steroidobacteraceae bacterium]